MSFAGDQVVLSSSLVCAQLLFQPILTPNSLKLGV